MNEIQELPQRNRWKKMPPIVVIDANTLSYTRYYAYWPHYGRQEYKAAAVCSVAEVESLRKEPPSI